MSFVLIILVGLVVAVWGTWIQKRRHANWIAMNTGPSDIADAVIQEAQELKLIDSLSAPLKGEPTTRFEAFTACPKCKVMDYYQVVVPQSVTRERLDQLLTDWYGTTFIDAETLKAARALPDEVFAQWLRCLTVTMKVPNPKAGETWTIERWGGSSITRTEPEFLTDKWKFPYPQDDKWADWEAVRYCPQCLHAWGQGSIQTGYKVDLAQLPPHRHEFVAGGKSEGSTGVVSGDPWLIDTSTGVITTR